MSSMILANDFKLLSVFLSQETLETETVDTASFVTDSVTKAGMGQLNPILVKVISVAVTILFAFVICKILHHILRKYIFNSESDKITGSHITSANIIYNVIRFVLILFVIIVIMDIIGINVTGFVAGFGIIGAVAGLAAQDLIKDLIAGTNIATERYFAIGDVIECQNYTGKVISVSMKSTKIQTYDGSVVTIQNHLIDKARIVSENCSITIPLAYDLERKKAYEVIDRIVDEIKKQPEIADAASGGISEFGDSSILYFVRFRCVDAFNIPAIKRSVLDIVIRELDKEGIDIPFNQLDIHQK